MATGWSWRGPRETFSSSLGTFPPVAVPGVSVAGGCISQRGGRGWICSSPTVVRGDAAAVEKTSFFPALSVKWG